MKREILSQQQSIAINMRAENVRNVEESQKNRDNQTESKKYNMDSNL